MSFRENYFSYCLRSWFYSLDCDYFPFRPNSWYCFYRCNPRLILVLPMQSSVDIAVTDAILGWYWCYRCNPRLILVLPMQSSVDIGVTNAVLGKPLISFQFLSWRHRCCNIHYSISNSFTSQKHPSYSVLIKRCYENIQRIYRGTHMPKCDFNMLFFCKFAAFLQKPFLKNTSGGVLLTFGWFLSDLPFNSK